MAKRDGTKKKDDKSDAKAKAGDAKKGAPKSAETIAKLEAKLEKRRTQLKETRARLRALEESLSETADISPFAPEAFPDLPAVVGVRLSAVEAAVRYRGRLDVMLAEIGPGARLAGVFTRSRTRSAPVIACERALAHAAETGDAGPFAFLVNAGNANAFTGDNGAKSVDALRASVAERLETTGECVFVSSTGVIGEPLPHERIVAKIDALAEGLSPTAWEDAARAIMTTDTYPKGAGAEITVDEAPVSIAGIAKGSGMIAPDMATMLVYLFTDAAIAQSLLQRIVSELTESTFNAITVDGDTSTSDTLLIAATGAAGNTPIETPQSPGYQTFRRALARVMKDLALQVVKDGEGCTKCVEILVTGARNAKAARRIGLSIANSPLVKTAWAGEDPNWGRIVMAVGKAGEEADRDRLSIRYGVHQVAENGWASPDYDEAAVAHYMTNPELKLTVDVGVGRGRATVWTCDLSHRYVSINADYRS